jgi:hypothetical protein
MARGSHVVIEGVVEAAFREVGEWLMHVGSAVVVALLAAAWPKLWVPPPPEQPSIPVNVPKLYGNNVLHAAGYVVVLGVVFAIAWLVFVRMRRPGTPQEARHYRAWWWVFAAGLLACIVILVGATKLGVGFLPWIGKLPIGEFLFLMTLLVLTAMLVWYLISVFRSPPTVIGAVPFGNYFARLRWR